MNHYDALSVVGWVSALAWALMLSVLVLEEIHIIYPRPLRLLVVRPWWPVRAWRVIAGYIGLWLAALSIRQHRHGRPVRALYRLAYWFLGQSGVDGCR